MGGQGEADFLSNPDGFLCSCLWLPQNTPILQSRLLIRGHRSGLLSPAPKLVINGKAELRAAADTGHSASVTRVLSGCEAQAFHSLKSYIPDVMKKTTENGGQPVSSVG